MTGRNVSGISKYKKIYAAVISILVFLILWQLVVSFTDVGIVMVGPIEVIKLFFVSIIKPIGHYTIQLHILWSLSRVMTGFILGSVLGVVLGILMGWFRPMNAIFRPLYEVIRPIPPIAWIPLSIVWFGIGEPSKYFIIFLAAFSAITMNAFAGVRAVDIRGQDSNSTVQIMVGIVAIGIIGFALAVLMRWIEARLCAWNVRGK